MTSGDDEAEIGQPGMTKTGIPKHPQPYTLDGLLDQTYWWRDRLGRWVKIHKMNSSYRLNCVRMMRRHAKQYQSTVIAGWLSIGMEHMSESTEDVLDRVISELEETPALDWLEATPLYGRLCDGLDPRTVNPGGTPV